MFEEVERKRKEKLAREEERRRQEEARKKLEEQKKREEEERKNLEEEKRLEEAELIAKRNSAANGGRPLTFTHPKRRKSTPVPSIFLQNEVRAREEIQAKKQIQSGNGKKRRTNRLPAQ